MLPEGRSTGASLHYWMHSLPYSHLTVCSPLWPAQWWSWLHPDTSCVGAWDRTLHRAPARKKPILGWCPEPVTSSHPYIIYQHTFPANSCSDIYHLPPIPSEHLSAVRIYPSSLRKKKKGHLLSTRIKMAKHIVFVK